MTDFERLVDEYGTMCRILGRFDEHPAGFDKAKATFRLARKRAALLAALPKGEPVVRWAVVTPQGSVWGEDFHREKDEAIDHFVNHAVFVQGVAKPAFSFYEGLGYRVARFELREVAGDE